MIYLAKRKKREKELTMKISLTPFLF